MRRETVFFVGARGPRVLVHTVTKRWCLGQLQRVPVGPKQFGPTLFSYKEAPDGRWGHGGRRFGLYRWRAMMCALFCVCVRTALASQAARFRWRMLVEKVCGFTCAPIAIIECWPQPQVRATLTVGVLQMHNHALI